MARDAITVPLSVSTPLCARVCSHATQIPSQAVIQAALQAGTDTNLTAVGRRSGPKG